ncbi:calponin homology domain-containing protein [Globomyces pollinis-pini]|nr:calponin homology domain-containing protein [Globomyces pollinis-pini]
MGGVNPFGGKPGNLFAGFNPSKVQLRSSSGSKPRTNSNHELTDIIVDEPHIRKWLNAKLNTDISTDTSLEKYLKDGQSLCQLMNVLRPEDPIKIQTGKLSFFHRENINHFLEGCEKLGINRLQLFETTDLLELNNFNQVLITLHCVEKLFPLEVESKTPEKEVLEVESEIPEKETTVEEAEKPVKDEAEESAQQ